MVVALVAGLTACTDPVPDDPWSEVRSTCELDEAGSPWAGQLPETLSQPCREQLILGFGVDSGAFSQESSAESRVESVLLGLYTLAATELGSLSEVQPSGFVSEALVRFLEREAGFLGEADPAVARLFYNHTARVVAEIVPTDEPEAGYAARYVRNTDSVLLDDVAFQHPPEVLAGLLVHEARHDLASVHITCERRPELEGGCDADATGAYGFQAGWYSLAVVPLLHTPAAADRVEAKAWEYLNRVNQW